MQIYRREYFSCARDHHSDANTTWWLQKNWQGWCDVMWRCKLVWNESPALPVATSQMLIDVLVRRKELTKTMWCDVMMKFVIGRESTVAEGHAPDAARCNGAIKFVGYGIGWRQGANTKISEENIWNHEHDRTIANTGNADEKHEKKRSDSIGVIVTKAEVCNQHPLWRSRYSQYENNSANNVAVRTSLRT